MKQRSREINVFSISALDLFASALGAFILMSIVFMVFFAMTSQESGQAEEVRVELADVEEALGRCETELSGSVDASELAACRTDVADLKGELDKFAGATGSGPLIPSMDVVICLDITGSMGAQIDGLKQEVVNLARVLDALTQSSGLGMVAYGDRAYDAPTDSHRIVPTNDMASLREWVNGLEARKGIGAGGNPDYEEAVDTALAEAVGMNWRGESELRYIIVITDAPAYRDKEQATYSTAADFARREGHHVSTVMVGQRNAQDFLDQLARHGRGQFIDDVGGQSMIAGILLAIMGV